MALGDKLGVCDPCRIAVASIRYTLLLPSVTIQRLLNDKLSQRTAWPQKLNAMGHITRPWTNVPRIKCSHCEIQNHPKALVKLHFTQESRGKCLVL